MRHRLLIVAPAAIAIAAIGGELAAPTLQFRALTIRAGNIALAELRRPAVGGARRSRFIPAGPRGVRGRVDYPPRAGAYAGRREAVRVELALDRASPLLGRPLRIRARATAAELPGPPGSPRRAVIVE